jgi:hypothetical protein
MLVEGRWFLLEHDFTILELDEGWFFWFFWMIDA